MKRVSTLISASILTLSVPVSTGFAQSSQEPELKLFAGPQSVVPGQPIFITAELHPDVAASTENVTLVFGNGLNRARFESRTENGIANFVVPAPTRTGRTTFLALTSTFMSYEAEILVVSDKLQPFEITVQQRNENEVVQTSTSVIQDQFLNTVENGVMAEIHWVENDRLILSENASIDDGKLLILTRCDKIQSASHVSIRIRNQQVSTPVTLTWCKDI